MPWLSLFLLQTDRMTNKKGERRTVQDYTYALHTSSQSLSPGKAPPGTGQRAEDGSEGQSREERVKGEVEQSLHPIIAQAFQRVNVVLSKNR